MLSVIEVPPFRPSFLAIHLHLRYQELVTKKRVFGLVISIWVFGACLSLVGLFVPVEKNRFIVYATVEVFCFTAAALLYVKINLAVRHHIDQIHSLQVQQQTQYGENLPSVHSTCISFS